MRLQLASIQPVSLSNIFNTTKQILDSKLDTDEHEEAAKPLASSPLAAGSLHQLLAPVKLRPFKSAYQLRSGDQLRLVCQLQRGYPQPQVSWYVGNRLVDSEFLREHAGQFRLLQFSGNSASSGSSAQQQQQQPQVLASPSTTSGGGEDEQQADRLVEINPIPLQRHQMQLTPMGRGSWVEFRELRGPLALSPEKLAIGTGEQRLRYMRFKLAQLTGQPQQQQQQASGSEAEQASRAMSSSAQGQPGALSILVVNKLEADKHSTRYSCRATSRANTDEVTTVLRVRG